MKNHWRVAHTLLAVPSLLLLTVAPAQASGAADGSKLEGTVVSVVQVTEELGGTSYAVTIQDEAGALFTFAMPADYPLTMRFWNLDWRTAAGSLIPGTEVKLDLDASGQPIGLKNEHDEELEIEGELVSYTPPADGQPGSITLLVDGVEVTVTLSGEAEEWVDPEAGLAYELEIEEGRVKLKVEERESDEADEEEPDAHEADEPDELGDDELEDDEHDEEDEADD